MNRDTRLAEAPSAPPERVVRLIGDRVESLAFVRELIDRWPASLAVIARIDVLAERVTG